MRPRKIAIIGCIAVMLPIFAVTLMKPACAGENPLNSDNYFKTEFVFEAKVLIDRAWITMGQSKYGGRNIVLITGGTFKGPNIEGIVIPGGADYQLIRPDGVAEFDARYALKTNDGVIIYVNNRILNRPDPGGQDLASPGQYRRSVLSFEAPLGSKYEWLNKFVYLGTLTIAITDKEAAVIIRVWKLL
jgi:hypothetical protein